MLPTEHQKELEIAMLEYLKDKNYNTTIEALLKESPLLDSSSFQNTSEHILE